MTRPRARSGDDGWTLYVVELCVDDDYRCVATSDAFRIVAP